MRWTNERIETLRLMWIAGKSARRISVTLGAGITRNAVIGKLHRLGLKRGKVNAAPDHLVDVRPRRPSLQAPPRARVSEPPATTERPAILTVDWKPRRIAFVDIEDGECRNEIKDGYYCGLPALGRSSWCARCSAILLRASPKPARTRADRIGVVNQESHCHHD